ncbi:MAG: ankyrin repeat domain-containing protein [Alphaproteobacteria bacterium]|nr:ankyrin repeat domain-containing protein [Alphaproteobacteria bacterium]
MKKDMKNTLRYKHMIMHLAQSGGPARREALTREIAGGKQWRIDAVMDALDAKQGWFQDINISDTLRMAAMLGRLSAVQRICKSTNAEDADPSRQGVIDSFNVAVTHGHYRVSDYLHEKCGARTEYMGDNREVPALNLAIRNGEDKKVAYLLKKAEDPKKCADYALNIAAATGTLKTVRMLVEKHGADANAEHRDGTFALAYRMDKTDIVKYLESKGADITQDGHETIYQAVQNNDVGMIEKLLDKAVPTSPDLLQNALHDGSFEAAEMLITKGGVKVDAENVLISTVSKNPEATYAFSIRHGGDAQKALDALKKDANLYRYGQRDKMQAFLEQKLPPQQQKPQAPKP